MKKPTTHTGVIAAMTVALPLFASPGTALAATLIDAFDSGLDAGRWSVVHSAPGHFTVGDTQGDVRLAKTGDDPDNMQTVRIVFDLDTIGGPVAEDFSMQIGFSDAHVSLTSSFELRAQFADASSLFASYEYMGSRLMGTVWTESPEGSTRHGVVRLLSEVLSGTFQISRTGGILTGSFSDSPLFSEEHASPLTGIEFALKSRLDGHSVTFDHFALTVGAVPEPSPALLAGAGILTVSFLRRRARPAGK